MVTLTVVALVVASLAATPATAAPGLNCADGDPGIHYTAPSNLTVADASNATVDSPFAGNESIAVGDVTVSANGTAFARVETATGETCLSDVDATTVPVTVETDAAAVTVEGSVDAIAFDDPATDDATIAYRASDGATVTLADAGHPAGTTLRVLDAETDSELGVAEVSSDGSLSLSLPASEDGTRVRLTTPTDETATAGPTPSDTPAEPSPTATRTPEAGGPPESGTDDGAGDGLGIPWPLLVVIALLAVIGAIAVLRRRE